jgi:ABC-2 type transport system permease protein
VSWWGATGLVARRELRERGFERGFFISTIITLVVLCGFSIGNAILSGPDEFRIGLVGDRAAAVAGVVERAATSGDIELETASFPDRGAATAALREGDVDAVLVDDGELLFESEPDGQLAALVQETLRTARIQQALVDAGVDEDVVAETLGRAPIDVRAVDPIAPEQRANSTVAFFGVILLYGQLFGYGYLLSSGVAEEKSSRVVELLLATIRPTQLLTGKILGIGTLALGQLILFAAVGLAVARVAGVLEFPAGALEVAGTVFLWFLFGFAFYCSLFAVAGSIVSRQEELQNTMTPINIVFVAGFLIAITALNDPEAPLAVIGSYLPPTAPLVMPARLALGQATWWQALVAMAISVAATVALIPLAGRLYSGSILRTGPRVKLGEAWRGTRSESAA